MALSSLVVRIGADLTDLNRGLGQANRDVERFGKKIMPLGRSLTRMGNSASVAAGSLSRLGGVLPGVAGGMGRVVGTLGVAGVALGETAVLTAGLTKGMRLLQAASTAVAASSAPVWLASLATPAGIAVAGIAALAATVWGLSKAWDALAGSKARAGGVKAFEIVDPSGRGRGSSEGLFANQDATFGLSDASVELTLAKQAVDAWGDAVEGIRPVTVALTKQWATARDLIVSALQDTSKFTTDATTQLYRMLAALKEVAKAAAPISTGKINVGGLLPTTKMFGHGLNAREQLGSRMDAGPGKMPSTLLRDLMGAISSERNMDGSRREASLTDTVGGMLGGAGGGIVQAFAAFGPLAAVLPIISGALEALEPVLVTLIEPLVEIGRIIGEALAPILEMLAPVLKLVVDLFTHNLAPILKGITTALSYVMEAFGWLVRAIGKAVDALPGVSAKRVINAGQEMIDAARAARRNTDATNKATEAVNDFAGALSNTPRVLNINALRHMIGGSGGGGGGGGGGGNGGGGVPVNPVRPGFEVRGDFIVQINGATDPVRTAEMVGREIDRRISRGGTNRLAVRFA